MGETGFCKNLRFFCGFLRKSAVSCGFLRQSATPKSLDLQSEPKISQKSAKMCVPGPVSLPFAVSVSLLARPEQKLSLSLILGTPRVHICGCGHKLREPRTHSPFYLSLRNHYISNSKGPGIEKIRCRPWGLKISSDRSWIEIFDRAPLGNTRRAP